MFFNCCLHCLQSGVGAHERVRLVHLEGLHQARAGDYARERLLARARSLLSFHSFADTDPVRDYNQWLRGRGHSNLPTDTTADEHSGSTSSAASASPDNEAHTDTDTQPADAGPARVEL